MHLRLVIVNTGGIAMILDDVYNEPRHGIYGLERIVVVARGCTFIEVIDAGFGADAEEK